jgi:hypothetical protein
MTWTDYIRLIKQYKIEQFGFDTHARVLGIDQEDAKQLWNKATGNEFKRFPRTEYTMRYLPEISTKFRPYWKLEMPHDYLIFYFTPTAPILIPNGIITDMGSIPLIFQNFISIYDREMGLAFLVHDLECEMQRLTRFTTDGMIYEVGSAMKTNWLRKNLIYAAVRLGNRFGKRDKVVRSFNVSEHNRKLITDAEQAFINSIEFKKHVNNVEKFLVK